MEDWRKYYRIAVDGIEDTVRGHAIRRGMNVSTVSKRISKGWSVSEALNTPPRRQTSELAQKCRDRGADYNVVRNRIKRGWSEAAALSAPVRGRKVYAVDGASGNIPSLARQFGLKPETVNSRIRRGWDLESALKTPAAKPKGGRVKSRSNIFN